MFLHGLQFLTPYSSRREMAALAARQVVRNDSNRNAPTSVLSPENRSLISLSTFVGEYRFLDTLLT
jgi:hypothetical protein